MSFACPLCKGNRDAFGSCGVRGMVGRGRSDSRQIGGGKIGFGFTADRRGRGFGRRRPSPAGNGIASAPARLQGLLEVRGLGIVRLPFVEKTAVVLTIDLCSADEIERLPDRFDGIMRLDPFCASAVAKIKLALRVAAGERHLLSDAETVIL